MEKWGYKRDDDDEISATGDEDTEELEEKTIHADREDEKSDQKAAGIDNVADRTHSEGIEADDDVAVEEACGDHVEVAAVAQPAAMDTVAPSMTGGGISIKIG